MRQFAELVGISNPYLSQIERGLRAPSEPVLQAIADALQVSADTLYDQAGVPREVDGPSKVVEAIREDVALTGRQRQAVDRGVRGVHRRGSAAAAKLRTTVEARRRRAPVRERGSQHGIGERGNGISRVRGVRPRF